MPGLHITLQHLGWDDSWREAAAAYPDRGRPGRVTRVDRGLCSLLTSHGPVRASLGGGVLDALAKDPAAGPVTGDWCLVRTWCDGPQTVEVVLPRRTSVTRAGASRTSLAQVLAANVDVAAIVVGLHPEPKLARIERLLAVAWDSGAVPIVVLSKADLVTDADAVAEDVAAVASGADVICCSTVTGRGVADVRGHVGAGGTLALLGASGHGKSSLANALVGAETLHTKEIRDDGKGRHTSVRRELLPLPGGGCVIDTPGLRGVGLSESDRGLVSVFRDINSLAAQCRFRDCSHAVEPGCAVLAAVEAGLLGVRRLDSWRKLQREQATSAGRADARLKAEASRRAALTKEHRPHRGR